MILLDTSGLLAALFPDQNRHLECRAELERNRGPFVLSPFVLAELDYLVLKFAGPEAELALLEDVAAEAYLLAPFTALDVDRARRIMGRFDDLEIGLADASLVVLSERYETTDLLTLDERHFRVVRAFGNEPFHILPSDTERLG